MRLNLSANLGFLWADRPLAERIRAAARAGFDAVECHFPYDEPPEAIRRALAETELPMLSLNTRPGESFGLAAMPDQTNEARAAIDEAIGYAAAIGARNVHVMAGRGGDLTVFRDNLRYAVARGQAEGVGVLIEPINRRDVPGYALHRLEDAVMIAEETGARIMFDCYHLQIEGGDLLRRFEATRALIGHIQFAAVPDRAEPDHGEVDYAWLLPEIARAGHDGFFGAEYRPTSATDDGLGWMRAFGR